MGRNRSKKGTCGRGDVDAAGSEAWQDDGKLHGAMSFGSSVAAEYRAGGVTHAQLAKKHGVSVHTLKGRVSPSGLAQARKRPGFVPLAVEKPVRVAQVMVVLGVDSSAVAEVVRLLQES